MSALQDFPRITPFLWFDSNAEEAVDFYLTVFPNSRRLKHPNAMRAMLQMKKLDIAELERAARS